MYYFMLTWFLLKNIFKCSIDLDDKGKQEGLFSDVKDTLDNSQQLNGFCLKISISISGKFSIYKYIL